MEIGPLMYGDLFQTRRLIIRAACSLAWLLMVIPCPTAAEEYYSGGTGEPNNPFRISTVADWQELVATPADWDRHFILTADIDLNDVPITPIGNDANNFTGVFDGNDHTIRNANMEMHATDCVGLFGCVGSSADIRDLGIEDAVIIGGSNVGSLVGRNDQGDITNCYASGSVWSYRDYAGGLVGCNSKGAISNCHSSASVAGDRDGANSVGGVVGWNDGGIISNCYSSASVSGAFPVGGLVGENGPDADISNCFSSGPVSGGYAGGLVGRNRGAIRNCSSTGALSDGGRLGGLVGSNEAGADISNCFSAGPVSGSFDVGGLVGWNHGAIRNCFSTGSVGGYKYVGGLVAKNEVGADISNCFSSGPVSGEYCVGGLVAENVRTTISNSYSSGTVSGTDYVGGLVGQNLGGTTTNCYSTGSVSGGLNVGGLVGYDYDGGAISDCYSTGSVTGNACVGGLVGRNDAAISDCYSTGSVTGNAYVGGLVGWNTAAISNCYSTGAVSADTHVGGLVGYDHEGTVSSSFWDVNTSGWTTSAAGTPKNTAEMKTETTFTSTGWDFVGEGDGTEDIWTICERTNYPRFVWQVPAGDIVCPDGVNALDFSALARYWHETNCAALDDCEGADIDLSGGIDFDDVTAVAESWLSGL